MKLELLHKYQHVHKEHTTPVRLGGDIVEWAAHELAALRAERDRLAALLREAGERAERARLLLSYAGQDDVATAAEAEANRNAAFHECAALKAKIDVELNSTSSAAPSV